jgi:hypothetical protein
MSSTEVISFLNFKNHLNVSSAIVSSSEANFSMLQVSVTVLHTFKQNCMHMVFSVKSDVTTLHNASGQNHVCYSSEIKSQGNSASIERLQAGKSAFNSW